MFAVIKTGGKQYKVAKDDVISVEKLAGDAGDRIEFTQVLMLGGKKEDGSDAVIGAPMIQGASVAAEVLEQGRGAKIIVFKKKRRQNYRRKQGHRQDLTVLRILDINAKAKKAASKKAATAKTPDAPKKEAAKAPAKKAAVKKTAAKKTATKKEAPKKPSADSSGEK